MNFWAWFSLAWFALAVTAVFVVEKKPVKLLWAAVAVTHGFLVVVRYAGLI